MLFASVINYSSIIFTMFLIILVVWLLNEITRYHGKKALTTKETVIFYLSVLPIILGAVTAFYKIKWILLLSLLIQVAYFILIAIVLFKMIKTVELGKRLKLYIVFGVTCCLFLLLCLTTIFAKLLYIYNAGPASPPSLLLCAVCWASLGVFYILVCRARTNYNRKEEKAKRREYREKKQKLREDSPNLVRVIEKFHRYPWLSVIANAIAFALFITPLKSGDMTKIIIHFGIGCIVLLVVQAKLPRSLRKETAMMFMEKCKKEDDESNDPYFYMHRYEVKNFGSGKWHKEEAFPMFIGTVLFVCNYVFYILSALLAVALAGVVAAVGVMIFFLHVICKAMAENSISLALLHIAKLAFLPLQLAFKFLATIYPFKWILAPFQKRRAYSATPRTQNGVSSYESDLLIQKYVRVNYPLPSGAHWERENLECRGADVYFSGRIVADSDSFDYPRYKNLLDDAKHDIKNMLESQVQDFMRDYPNAKGAKVTVRIDGELR